MRTHAIIRPKSALHNLWRRQGRLVAALEGTRFVWRSTHYEATGDIADLPALVNHPDTQVAVMGQPTAPAAPKPVTAPTPTAKTEAAPSTPPTAAANTADSPPAAADYTAASPPAAAANTADSPPAAADYMEGLEFVSRSRRGRPPKSK